METATQPRQAKTLTEPLIVRRNVQVKPVERSSNEMDFIVSTDAPLPNMWGDREQLVHTAEAGDISRIDRGMCPLLYNHGHDPKLGNITSGRFENGALILRALWDVDDPEVKRYFEKFQRGFLNAFSIYAVPRAYGWAQDSEGEYLQIYKWELIEASAVTVPADADAKVIRSMYHVKIDPTSSPSTMEVETPTQTAPPQEAPPQDLAVVREQAGTSERDRILSIQAMGAKYNNTELANELVKAGTTVDIARSKFADHILEKVSQESPPEAGQIGLSKKENKDYSILRAVAAALSGDWTNAGLEKEASIAAAEKAGRPADIERGQFYIPVADLKISREALSLPSSQNNAVIRAALASQATNIGELITEDFRSQDLITLGREQSLSARLNIMMMRNLKGSPIRFPRQIQGLGFSWRNEAEDIAEYDLDFTSIEMTPKLFGGMFLFSYLAAHQAEIPTGLEAFARRDFVLSYSEFLDNTWLNGTGVAPEPEGVLNMAGMQTIAGRGANGEVLNPEDIRQLISPIRRTKLCRKDELEILATINYTDWLAIQKDTTGRYLWLQQNDSIAIDHPDRLWGLPYHDSTHMPENLTKGTGTDLSALLIGPFSRGIIIGEWYGIMIDTSIHHRFKQALNAVRMIGSLDVANRLPQCFGVVNDIVTA